MSKSNKELKITSAMLCQFLLSYEKAIYLTDSKGEIRYEEQQRWNQVRLGGRGVK